MRVNEQCDQRHPDYGQYRAAQSFRHKKTGLLSWSQALFECPRTRKDQAFMSKDNQTITTSESQRKKKTEKLPALHFYPGDWKKDVAVQSLDPMARYVWFECLLLMHDSEERGVLVLNGKPMTIDQISRAINLDKQITSKSLEEVRDSGVCDVREDGAIINRRMVRDEAIRQERIKAGLKGGNPNLLKQNSSKLKKTGYLSSKQNPENENENENEDSNKGEYEGDVVFKRLRFSKLDWADLVMNHFYSNEQKAWDVCEHADDYLAAHGKPQPKNCLAYMRTWIRRSKEFKRGLTHEAKRGMTTEELNPEIFEEIFK